MPLFRSKAEDKVREAGFDPARLPPGQYYTDKWPVLQAGSVPRVDLATWDFRAFGLVKQPIRLSFDDVVALGAREQTSDIHPDLVEGWVWCRRAFEVHRASGEWRSGR